MTSFFNSNDLVPCGNGGERRRHLVDGAEGITRPVDEQRWGLQLREVLGAELFHFTRRVQRIGEEQQGIGNCRSFCSQQSRLPATVRMPAQHDVIRRDLAHCFGRKSQSFAVARGCARERRTRGTHLTIRKIAA